MWALAFLLSVAANADANVDAQLQHCDQSVNTAELNAAAEKGDPAAMEQMITTAKAAIERDCREASDGVAALESRARRLSAAAAKMDQALAEPAQRVDEHLKSELKALNNELSDFRSIPNLPSDSNNRLFLQYENLFDQSGQRIADLDRDWDGQFVPTPDGDLDLIKQMARDQEISSHGRAELKSYLARIPPYLLGEGPAPRQKIDFLQSQLALVKQEIELKRKDYSRPIINDANQLLRESVSPDAIAAKVEEMRSRFLRTFSFENSAWAVAADAAGACRLARDVFSEQINALKSSVQLLPMEFQAPMSTRLAGDIEMRRRFISAAACDSDDWRPGLEASLKRWARMLPVLCRKSAIDLKVAVSDLLMDIRSFGRETGQTGNAAESEVVRLIGEELWSRGFYLATSCSAGG